MLTGGLSLQIPCVAAILSFSVAVSRALPVFCGFSSYKPFHDMLPTFSASTDDAQRVERVLNQ